MNVKAWILVTLAIFLASCAVPAPTRIAQSEPASVPASTPTPQANLPNPAAVYCEQQGYKSEIRTAADGSQSGVCIFPDSSECDEWMYFRGECGPNPRATASATIPAQAPAPSGDRPPAQTGLMPAGAIIDPRNGSMDFTESFVFYNTQGLILGELLAPRGGQVHVAGHYQGSLNLPLLFHAMELEGEQHALYINSGSTPADPGGKVSVLVPLESTAMVAGLVGVPGEPIISYSVFQPVSLEDLQTQFFVGDLASIASAMPVLTLDSKESRYWEPVAITMKDGRPAGLWFTRHPWGIGGDIVFMVNEGLSYLDLSSGSVMEILPPESQLDSLSQDQTWVVYSQRHETGPGFFIRDLKGGDPIAIGTLPESDRGAGDGLFSPSNTYLAWREARGSLFDQTFEQTIRVATLDGQSLGDYQDVPFYKAAELSGTGTMVRPVGWLDDEKLLVQVTAAEKPHEGTIVQLNAITGELTLFARGFFAGLFYP